MEWRRVPDCDARGYPAWPCTKSQFAAWDALAAAEKIAFLSFLRMASQHLI